jgi:succinoglycan biosynthesis protein ExoL
MTRIAFFGHDAGDAAVRRRANGFMADGLEVSGFMMRRGEAAPTPWTNVDLGQTFSGAYLQRIKSIITGARIASDARDELARADIIYARNLDMLATAFLAKRLAKLDTPVIYECLDVHRLMTRKDIIGEVFRRGERALLRRCRRLVVSSPGFLTNYFEVRHPGAFKPVLLENRIAEGGAGAPRPARAPTPVDASASLRLGWVGVLRCRRSMGLLMDVARKLGDRVQIDLHGVPALREIPDFHEQVAALPNLKYHGRYRSPEDLSTIYGALDVVWAGDFMEAGYNSVWLLPNRIYEGGYFAVPPIAPAGTQTARWIADRKAGFVLPEPLDLTLPDLVSQIAADRRRILERRTALLDLPEETFIQPAGELLKIIEDALGKNESAPGAMRTAAE